MRRAHGSRRTRMNSESLAGRLAQGGRAMRPRIGSQRVSTKYGPTMLPVRAGTLAALLGLGDAGTQAIRQMVDAAPIRLPKSRTRQNAKRSRPINHRDHTV